MIMCCGEALIDMLPRQLPDGTDSFLPVPGGAMLNTAVALGRLGEKVGFVSGISNDLFGEQLLAHMISSGVATGHCLRSSRPTTLAFIKLKNGQAQFSFFDENTAGRNLNADILPALPLETTTLHFGGISLISEPCGSSYEVLMNRHCQSRVISMDPNIRASFVQSETAYRNRLARMLRNCDIIKISDEDLSWLRPGEAFEDVALGWMKDGAAIVVLTQGENGARALTKNFQLSVDAKPATIVDTIGAGDAFNAGLLSNLSTSDLLTKDSLRTITENHLRAALEFAAKVSAHTVAQAGANPPWRNGAMS